MSSMTGFFIRPVFRPLSGLLLSLLFHATLILIFIGWMTSEIPKVGVLPPAISLQLGVYQLERSVEQEVNNAPKQMISAPEEVEPEVVEKTEKLPETPLVKQGTLTKVSEKKRKPKNKPKQESKPHEDVPIAQQESSVAAAPASGAASSSSANFSSNASAAISGLQDWHATIHQRLAKAKRYPRAALRFRSTGVSQVKVVLDGQGKLISVALFNSSGTKLLDKEAVETIKRAAPFPAPPTDILIDGRIEFIAPITFDTTMI